MSQFPISNLADPFDSQVPKSKSQGQLVSLIRALEAKRQEVEQDRNELRLTMAAVEAELIQLTSQQAELQKLQVAIDRLLKYLKEQTGEHHLTSPTCKGLADAGASGTA